MAGDCNSLITDLNVAAIFDLRRPEQHSIHQKSSEILNQTRFIDLLGIFFVGCVELNQLLIGTFSKIKEISLKILHLLVLFTLIIKFTVFIFWNGGISCNGFFSTTRLLFQKIITISVVNFNKRMSEYSLEVWQFLIGNSYWFLPEQSNHWSSFQSAQKYAVEIFDPVYYWGKYCLDGWRLSPVVLRATWDWKFGPDLTDESS